ncbi:MAG: serine hydrolase [Solirubrobacterales bacterium]
MTGTDEDLHRGARSRPWLPALVLACLALPGAAFAAVDPERTSDTVVLHSEGINKTEDQIYDATDAAGQRVTDIDIHSTDPLRFDYTAVTNFGLGSDLYKGPYARDGGWVEGLTGIALSSFLDFGGYRIIDLEPYRAGGDWEFAAAFVKNQGDAGKAWWWYYDKTPAQIEALEQANNARAIDIDPMTNDTSSVVMISNTGADYAPSELYFGGSQTTLEQTMRQQRLRPIDVEPRGPYASSYDAIAVPDEGKQWDWYTTTPADVANGSAPGERPYDLDLFTGAVTEAYSVLSMNPPDDQGDAAESTRLTQRMEHFFPGGEYGFYAKRIGGKAVSGYAVDAVHEPASAVKVLALLYALKQVDKGLADLNTTQVRWIDYGTPCTAGQQTSLLDALRAMMQQSNNSATHGVVAHFGNSAINAFAKARGWRTMRIRGCGIESGRSDWSSRDAVDLYEQALDGSILKDGESVKFLKSIMSPSWGLFTGVVHEEAAGDQQTELYVESAMDGVWKGGGLGWCLPAPADCGNGHFEERSFAGTLQLPFLRKDGKIRSRTYALEWWVEDFLPCSYQGQMESDSAYYARCPQGKLLADGYNAITGEVGRKPIRRAVASFQSG